MYDERFPGLWVGKVCGSAMWYLWSRFLVGSWVFQEHMQANMLDIFQGVAVLEMVYE